MIKRNKVFLPIILKSKSSTYIEKIIATEPIAYWPFNETSGTTAKNYGTLGTAANGVYTGPTLNNHLAPGGSRCPNFDGLGTDDRCNIYSAALNSNFNRNLFSIFIWAKMVDPQVWTNGVAHSIIRLVIDSGNQVSFDKAFSNPLFLTAYAGLVPKFAIVSSNTADWYHMCVTFDKANDEVKFYFNAEQQGATQNSLGTMTGNLSSTSCMVAAQSTTGGAAFNGYISHPAIYNKALTHEEISYIYNGGL